MKQMVGLDQFLTWLGMECGKYEWIKEFMLSLLTTPLEILIGQIIGGGRVWRKKGKNTACVV